MSVATEFAPSVHIPARARRDGAAARPLALVAPGAAPVPLVVPRPSAAPLASVSVLRRPADADRVAVRLTRRGMVVVALLVAALGAVLVWIAAASAPAQSAAPAGPAVVTVQPGDTLWSIAGRVAPDSDPRATVSDLQTRNHLQGVDLVPGQELHVR